MTGVRGCAVVTGGARGIGQSIATTLAETGISVAIADRDGAEAEVGADELNRRGLDAMAVQVDVRERAEVDHAVDIAVEQFSAPLEVLVNNAGFTELEDPEKLTAEQWDQMLVVNARGTLFGLQAAARAMRPSRHGVIVNVASAVARSAYPLSPHYAASKAAVLSLTKSFAAHLAPWNIRVNSVAPAIVDTELWAGFDRQIASKEGLPVGKAKQQRIDQIPLRRAASVHDVAAAVAYLVSADASFITGECLHLTGGSLMV